MWVICRTLIPPGAGVIRSYLGQLSRALHPDKNPDHPHAGAPVRRLDSFNARTAKDANGIQMLRGKLALFLCQLSAPSNLKQWACFVNSGDTPNRPKPIMEACILPDVFLLRNVPPPQSREMSFCRGRRGWTVDSSSLRRSLSAPERGARRAEAEHLGRRHRGDMRWSSR